MAYLIAAFRGLHLFASFSSACHTSSELVLTEGVVKNRESTVRRRIFSFLHYTHGSLDEATLVDTKLLFVRFDGISFFFFFFCIAIQHIFIGPRGVWVLCIGVSLGTLGLLADNIRIVTSF